MTNRITEGEQDWLTADEFVTLTHVLGPRRVARIIAEHNALRDARELLEEALNRTSFRPEPEHSKWCARVIAALKPASGGQA